MTANTARTVAFPSPSTQDAPSGSATTAAGLVPSLGAPFTTAPFTQTAIELIEARGLDIELMARLGVGGSDRFPDGIAIAYVEQGAVVACKHRTLDA
ncbi:MAG: hypothetical protein WCP68_21720, partial [Enhydrobacter sp.]